jgi:hypothetical protein
MTSTPQRRMDLRWMSIVCDPDNLEVQWDTWLIAEIGTDGVLWRSEDVDDRRVKTLSDGKIVEINEPTEQNN